jgi:4-hydroxythreonine-4-phosphate dehydrogenase
MTGDALLLAMTMGDPAGIGPELALAAWRDRTPGAPFVVFAAPRVLAAAAKRAGFTAPIIEIDPSGARAAFSNGLPVVPLENGVEDAPGRPSQCRGDDRIDRARG